MVTPIIGCYKDQEGPGHGIVQLDAHHIIKIIVAMVGAARRMQFFTSCDMIILYIQRSELYFEEKEEEEE